jgi:hypothetical protein
MFSVVLLSGMVSVIMLILVILNVIMLNIIMLIHKTLNVIMLDGIILSGIMMHASVPSSGFIHRLILYRILHRHTGGTMQYTVQCILGNTC